MATKKEIMQILRDFGWDNWNNEERKWYCYNMAALLHAYNVGAHGSDAITAANQFLADHGRESLPAGFPITI